MIELDQQREPAVVPGSDSFVARVAPDGTLGWVLPRPGGIASLVAEQHGDVVDVTDLITSLHYAVRVARLSLAGTELEVETVSGDKSVAATSLVVGRSAATVVLTSLGSSKITTDRGVTYAAQGTDDLVLLHTFGAGPDHLRGFAGGSSTVASISGDDRDHLLLGGSAVGPVGLLDGGAAHDPLTWGFVVDLDPSDDPVWRVDLETLAPYPAFEGAYGVRAGVVAANADGLFVGGDTDNDLALDGRTLIAGEHTTRSFLLRLTKDGAFVWAHDFGPRSGMLGNAGFDSGGRLRVVGTFEGTIDLDGHTLTSAGKKDAFIAWLDERNGNVLDAIRIGGTGDDQIGGTARGSDGALYVTGSFRETVDFGDGVARTSKGGADIFVMKLAVP